MRFTPDGGVVPAGVLSSIDEGTDGHYKFFGLYRGYVQSVTYPDDSENLTGRLEYVVRVEGQDYPGVIDLSRSGGIFSNHVRVRHGVENIDPQSIAKRKNNNNKTWDEDKDGEFVWCTFIKGDAEFPVIIGSDEHTRISENPDYIKPTRAMGEFERYEFNGYEFIVDKDANLTVSHIGQKDPTKKGAPKNPLAITPNRSKIEWKNNGDLFIDINDSLLKTSYLKAAAQITHELGSGLKVTYDGTADSAEIKTALGATLSLNKAKVGFGTSGIELLAKISEALGEVVTYLQGESTAASTYVSTTVGPGILNPSRVTDAGTAITKLTKIKGEIDTISGGV